MSILLKESTDVGTHTLKFKEIRTSTVVNITKNFNKLKTDRRTNRQTGWLANFIVLENFLKKIIKTINDFC